MRCVYVQTGTTEPAQQISVTPDNRENLKSPAVNLTALAERVEAAHFPDPTATRPPPPATGESVTRQSMSVHNVMWLLSQQDHLLLIAFHHRHHHRHHLLILVSYYQEILFTCHKYA